MEAMMLLYALTFAAGFMLYQQMRLGRRGELTTKLTIATVLGVVAIYPAAFGVPAEWAGAVVWAALLALGWFALLPLVGRSISRRHAGYGRLLEEVAIWSAAGRRQAALNRAAVALAGEDTDGALAALAGLDDDEAKSYRAIALALAGQFRDVLEIRADTGKGVRNLHVRGARVHALVELGRTSEARAELQELAAVPLDTVDASARSSLTLLARLDIAAVTGDAEDALEVLRQPLPQVHAPHILLQFGRALERSGRRRDAAATYKQAWERLTSTQPITRDRIRLALAALGEEPPKQPHIQLAKPVATTAIVGTIGVAFLVQKVLEGKFGVGAPFELGAFFMPPEGEPWRLLSYALVHAGLVHAGMNAWVMWDVGKLLERRAGPAAVAGSFTLGTLGGSLLSQALTTEGGLVGASGGVLGVGGALLVEAYLSSTQEGAQLFRGVGTWLIIIMAFSVAFPNVSIWGHLGGIIAGAAFGFVLSKARGRAFDLAVIGASAVAFLWAIAGIVDKARQMNLL